MAVSALSVANYFVKKALEEPRDCAKLTPMKLLKMIYLTHGLYLAKYDKPLIKENIIAWRYGPVVEDVYNAFKHYGNRVITEMAYDRHGKAYSFEADSDCAQVVELLNTVWDACLEYTGIQLSNWSHEKDSPWDIVYNQTPSGQNGLLPIDNLLMRNYFIKSN